MQFSNLHTHSTFSDGKGTLRENIESAISKNMLSLGFSDHSFTACDTSYCMMLEDYPEYIASVLALKEEYKTKLPIFLGIEKDYYSEINRADFDYVIASVHYIIERGVCYPIDHSRVQQEDCIANAFGGDVFAMAERYYSMVVEHVAASRPDVVGHFDVLNKFSIMPENDEKYRAITLRAMDEALKYCKVFEVNTGGISRGWRKSPYPSDYLLRHLLENGGEVTLSSDSHEPKNLDFYFDETVQMLKSIGFTYTLVLTPTGFEKMPI